MNLPEHLPQGKVLGLFSPLKIMRIPIICCVFHLSLSSSFHVVARSSVVLTSEIAGEVVGEPGPFLVLNSFLTTLSITPELGPGGEKAQAVDSGSPGS